MFSSKFLKNSSYVVLSASLISIAQSSGVFADDDLSLAVSNCEDGVEKTKSDAQKNDKGNKIVKDSSDKDCKSDCSNVESSLEISKPQNSIGCYILRFFLGSLACILVYIIGTPIYIVLNFQREQGKGCKELFFKWIKALKIYCRMLKVNVWLRWKHLILILRIKFLETFFDGSCESMYMQEAEEINNEFKECKRNFKSDLNTEYFSIDFDVEKMCKDFEI